MATDPSFSDVSLLVRFDGPDGSQTFTDISNDARTVTAQDFAKISTDQSKFGGSSFFTDDPNGSQNSAVTPNSTGLLDPSGDFTIQLWYRPKFLSTTASFFSTWADAPFGNPKPGILFYASDELVRVFGVDNAGDFVILRSSSDTAITPLVQDTWYYLDLTKSGSTWYLFVNGVLEWSGTQSGTVGLGSTNAYISSREAGNYEARGYIDDYRITNGVALNTTSYTPPVVRHPAPSTATPFWTDFDNTQEIC